MKTILVLSSLLFAGAAFAQSPSAQHSQLKQQQILAQRECAKIKNEADRKACEYRIRTKGGTATRK